MTKLSEYKVFSTQLLGLFLKSCTSISDQTELVYSFVQILEYDEFNEVSQNDRILNSFKKVMEDIDLTLNNLNQNETLAKNQTSEELRSECRLKALKLILFYLRQSQPNLAHLLLGMDIKKPLGNQEFYNPGKCISSRCYQNKYVAFFYRIFIPYLQSKEIHTIIGINF